MVYHRSMSAVRRDNAIEQLRRTLPVNVYLSLLHNAACSGFIPILDSQGKPTGEYTELPPKERLNTLTYLVNKAMPDLKSNEQFLPPPQDEALEMRDMAEMTTEELAQVIRSSAAPTKVSDAVFST